jgi:hypothetical protein
VKHMRVVEEDVSLSQPKTIAVLPEEEHVPVPRGPSIAVPPEEEVSLEEEEFPSSTIVVLQGPPVVVPPEEEEVPAAPLVAVLRKDGDALSLSQPW